MSKQYLTRRNFALTAVRDRLTAGAVGFDRERRYPDHQNPTSSWATLSISDLNDDKRMGDGESEVGGKGCGEGKGIWRTGTQRSLKGGSQAL